jgi:enoyl-CoA hydratase
MLAIETRGEVAVLRMEHGKANALDLELLEELAARLAEVEGSAAKALVLTGAGTIFSAGVDLFRLLDAGRAYLDRFLPALDVALRRLYTFPRPAVAAVNGHAIAGGCILALACDRRLMADGPGRIGVPELLVGVPFPPLPLAIVAAALAPPVAQEAIATGRTYTAAEALARGLADELAPPEALLDRACRAAADLGAVPPRAYALTKRQLRAPALARADASADLAAEVAAAWADEATRATIRTYLERTVRKK